jgi:EmrB/QacA subfamily drug resistance transporter
VVFTAASVLCGAAQTQEMLVGARFLQGIGGAMTSAVILGMIVTMFTEPREQAKAMGVYGFVASAGGSVGLLAGGILTQSINWHWIFFINIPIGIATLVLGRRLLPNDKGIGFGGGADVPGAVLITSALMLGVYTIVDPAAKYGWGATRTLVLAGLSVALTAAFFIRQARIENPLVPLKIFRSRNLSGVNALQILLVPGMFGTFFLVALYCERVLGYDALEIGLAFLPGTLIMGTMSLRYAERLMMRFGPVRTLVPALGLTTGALVLFTRLPVDGSYVQHLLPSMILFGFGMGAAFPPLMMLAMSGVEPQDAGLASGLVNTSAQIGGALGLAVLATLSATRTENLIDAGRSVESALVSGYHLAFVIGAALMVAAMAVAMTVLQAPKHLAHGTGQPDSEQAYSEAA